jgi:hypothetical protein
MLLMAPSAMYTWSNTLDGIYALMDILSICAKCVGKAGFDELDFLYLVHLLASWVCSPPIICTKGIDRTTLYGLGKL